MDARWLCRCQWPTGFSSPVLHPFGIGVTLPVLPDSEPGTQWPQPHWCSGWATRGEWATGGTRPPRPRPSCSDILSLSLWLQHQGRVGAACECVAGRRPQRGTLGAWGCARPGCPPRGRRPARVGQRRCPAPDRAARAGSHNKRGLRRWRRQTPLDLAPPPQAPPRGRGAACVPRHRSAARRRRAAWSKWSRRSHPGRQASGPRLPAPLGRAGRWPCGVAV